MKLKDKVAIITGAGAGMGRAISLLYAKEGAKIVAADINENCLSSLVNEITINGGKAIGIVTDVTKETDIEKLFLDSVTQFGGLNILVNNAGIMDGFVPAAEITDGLWEKVFAVNVTGPMRAIRKAIPLFLKKNEGTILNIASIGGLSGSRAGPTYTASKHALIGLTKNIGYQYAKLGIRCNAIAPGAIATDMDLGKINEFGLEKIKVGSFIKQLTGEIDDIAQAALFLASDEAKFINGTVLTVDGGFTAF